MLYLGVLPLLCSKAADLGLGLIDLSVALLAPEPDSAMAASATSLLQAAIGSVLPSSTAEEAPVGSEKGALIGAEEAAPGCHGATLLLEGPKILPGKRTLISSLYFNSFPFAFFVCLDEAFGSADQPSTIEEQP